MLEFLLNQWLLLLTRPVMFLRRGGLVTEPNIFILLESQVKFCIRPSMVITNIPVFSKKDAQMVLLDFHLLLNHLQAKWLHLEWVLSALEMAWTRPIWYLCSVLREIQKMIGTSSVKISKIISLELPPQLQRLFLPSLLPKPHSFKKLVSQTGQPTTKKEKRSATLSSHSN